MSYTQKTNEHDPRAANTNKDDESETDSIGLTAAEEMELGQSSHPSPRWPSADQVQTSTSSRRRLGLPTSQKRIPSTTRLHLRQTVRLQRPLPRRHLFQLQAASTTTVRRRATQTEPARTRTPRRRRRRSAVSCAPCPTYRFDSLTSFCADFGGEAREFRSPGRHTPVRASWKSR